MINQLIKQIKQPKFSIPLIALLLLGMIGFFGGRRPIPEAAITGNQFYVAPKGTPTGLGTLSSPWDLQTALSGGKGLIQPGATVYLRDGVYNNKYTSSLRGSTILPITVQSYPGEW